MQCQNHPDVSAGDRCVGCGKDFCGDCLVEVVGKKYCAGCKYLFVQGRQVVREEATVPCKEANTALLFAIVSVFCCGCILGPIAVIKAVKARNAIAEDPRLTGFGKANAALFIGIVSGFMW